MSKGKTKKQEVKKISQLTVINHTAAGIDVSDTEMMVAYPISADQLEVRVFGCFTCELKALVECLKSNRITSIAMESTGVYWITLFLLLQDEGFEVYLVNAKHVKNVTGRKDDESDAEWIQKLHSCGLLRPSFQPDLMTRALRDILRHRKEMVRTSTTFLNRMQKALELMNLKIHTVISDIDGKTGSRIIEAILAGEHNPERLADLKDSRIKASREELVQSLEGYYKKEHLYILKDCYDSYRFQQQKIRECDHEIEQQLMAYAASRNQGEIPKLEKVKRKTSYKKKAEFDVTSYLKSISGVDVTLVTGISENTALTLLSEVGCDLTPWKTEHHFTSWLGLTPNTKISGGKILSSKIKKKKNYAAQAFRMAANSLSKSQTPLGEYYRRIRSRAGAPKAVVASARKLAIIYYKMIMNKAAYNPESLALYQKRYKDKKICQLKKKIALLEAS